MALFNDCVKKLLLLTACWAPLFVQAAPNHSSNSYNLMGQQNDLFTGGLTENDIIDIDPQREITEEDIQFALEYGYKSIVLSEGQSVILVQSGKQFPDVELQKVLSPYFQVSTYPGFAQTPKRVTRRDDNNTSKPNSYLKILRLIAAKSHQTNIIVFWDALEAGKIEDRGLDVTWTPVKGNALPEDTKYLRYAIRFAVVDVATGEWGLYTLPLQPRVALAQKTSRFGKRSEEQHQINDKISLLKIVAYQNAVNDLLKRFSVIKSKESQKKQIIKTSVEIKDTMDVTDIIEEQGAMKPNNEKETQIHSKTKNNKSKTERKPLWISNPTSETN